VLLPVIVTIGAIGSNGKHSDISIVLSILHVVFICLGNMTRSRVNHNICII
jgi:hypothetical protein